MKASFEVGGYILDIVSSGESLTSRDGKTGTSTHRAVGMQLTYVSLDRQESHLAQFTMKPSEARAIASMLLSAATESGKSELG